MWPFKKRHGPETWKYAGDVRSQIEWTDNGKPTGNTTLVCWVLEESSRGNRRVTRSVVGYHADVLPKEGTSFYSAHAADLHTKVHAWVAGGPMPGPSKVARSPDPEPEPEPEPEPVPETPPDFDKKWGDKITALIPREKKA